MGGFIRTGAFILLLLVFLLFTDNTWWLAPVGSALIILLSNAVWPVGILTCLVSISHPATGGHWVLQQVQRESPAVVWGITPTQGITVTPLWSRATGSLWSCTPSGKHSTRRCCSARSS